MGECGTFVSACVGWLLLIASLSKLTSARKFERTIQALLLIPPVLARPVAIGVIVLETSLGLGLVIQPMLWLSVGAATMFALFAAVIACNLVAGRKEINCGCFGTHSNDLQWSHVASNTVIAIAAIASGIAAAPFTNIGKHIALRLAALVVALIFVIVLTDQSMRDLVRDKLEHDISFHS